MTDSPGAGTGTRQGSIRSLREVLASGAAVVLDGGLATSLEDRGHDLADDLWSARLLRDAPEEIRAVHAEHVSAGADIVTSASYQASRRGFAGVGIGAAEADRLIAHSVHLARESGARWVAASVGPYGALLPGGQEYVGRYGVPARTIRDVHAQRIDVLVAAAPDVLAVETIPDLDEAEVLLPLLESTGLPWWMSFSCRDDTHLNAGQEFARAVRAVSAADGCVAVGVNCTKPEYVTPLLASAASPLPSVVYPNAGRTWDGDAHRWRDDAQAIPAGLVREWHAQGARIIGGCCGLGSDHVSTVRAVVAESTADR